MRRALAVALVLTALVWSVEPSAAQQPRAWIEPSSGSCSEVLVLRGEGFAPNSAVQVARPEWVDSVDLGGVVTDEAGRFERTLPHDALPEECHPGQRHGFHLRPRSGELVVVEYAVRTPWRLAVTSERTCDVVVSLRGEGFPPGEQVRVWSSPDTSWAAHDFVELARGTTDASGMLLVDTLRALSCEEVGGGVLVVARLADHEHAMASWSTWLVIATDGEVTPAPAGTGHGAPTRAGADMLSPAAGAACVLLLLGVSRWATGRVSRG